MRRPEAAIEARGLVVAYAGHVAVASSDLVVPAGSLTAVIGPNGAGKSTLLNAVVGLVAPAAGTLRVLGADPRTSRRRVAYVPQSTRVDEAMPITVREVVAMARYAHLGPFRRFGERDREAVDEALDRLDVADLERRHLGELSGGQRHRVFVAQGLAQEADLLLLDEPVTGLDVVSRARIVEVVREELVRGATVVYTTHDLADAAEADLVVLMAGGVVAAGPPLEVLTPEVLAVAYGVGVLRLAERRVVLDDAHHVHEGRHRHLDRRRER